MTGVRKHLAQGLLATILISAIGVMASGWVSTRGDVWELVCMVFAFFMLASLLASLGLVAATYVKFKIELNRLRGRPPLSDDEFIAMLSDPTSADPEQVSQVRALAARVFRRIGGDRFQPGDRLNEDLHLRDLDPFKTEDFCLTLEKATGLPDGEMLGMLAAGQLSTFGDLVLLVSSRFSQVKEGAMTTGLDRSEAL
jgi:hypothetical protein